MTVVSPDPTGVMKALSNVRITVYARDTTNPVKIYQNHDGTTQGPTAESGATGGPNPFLTGPGGSVEFWCDGPAEIDVKVEDTVAPARVATRTIGWSCMPAAAGSIPTSMLAGDAALDLDALGPEILRQFDPVGTVIDWWRPSSSVPLPSGWEVCDGHQVPAGQHEFAGLAAAAINLPDLRNVFVLGADKDKADGTGAGTADNAASAPGIRGSGGSQQHTLVTLEIPAHQHADGTLGAASAGSHTHADTFAVGSWNIGQTSGWNIPIGSSSWQRGLRPSGGTWADAITAESSSVGYTSGQHTHPLTGSVTAGGAHTHDVTGATADTGGGGAHNNIPRYVGLLKLMKVRRS